MNYMRCYTCLTAAAFLVLPQLAEAAECPAGYPSGPITVLAGNAPGGGTDTVTRKLVSTISKEKGWTFVVENVPGAAGAVMATRMLTVPADGMTIGGATTTTMSILPYESNDITYTHDDFRYLGSAMVLNYALVALADAPYDTLEEFVAYAKEKGRATVSLASVSYEIALKKIAEHFGVNLVPIPGAGSAEALKDALGGHVDATVQGTAHVGHIRAGKMVQLSTLTSKRAPYAPDTMTVAESGVDLVLDGHVVFFLPKDVPDDIASCLTDAFASATEDKEFVEFLVTLDTEPGNLGPEGTFEHLSEAATFYKAELKK